MSPTRTFCTYFDHRYLARGLALYNSLRKVCPSFRLWVLCLDEECEHSLSHLDLPEVHLITVAELERDDPELQGVKTNRSLVEYYFTCTPSLSLYVLRHDPSAEEVTYVDADIAFFADPEGIFEELGSSAIGIVEHRFPPSLRHLEEFGIYNVGVLVFRRGPHGEECLRWWRERCIEWCYDRVENGRFADQGYLNDWPNRFSHVAVLKQSGVNLAPWNMDNSRIEPSATSLRVDGEPLICFHFHGLKLRYKFVYDLGLQDYGVVPTDVVLNSLYIPYVECIERLEKLHRTTARRRLGGRVTDPASTSLQPPFTLTRGKKRSGPSRLARDAARALVGFSRDQYLLSISGRKLRWRV